MAARPEASKVVGAAAAPPAPASSAGLDVSAGPDASAGLDVSAGLDASAESGAASVEPVSSAGPAGSAGSAGSAGRSGSGRWQASPRLVAGLRVTGGVAVALVAIEAAAIECFLVPLRAGRVPVPLAAAAAVAGNILLARLIVAVTGRRWAALVPPLAWLAVVLVLAAPRAEGDLVVPGTWPGLLFLFLGAIAGAFGAATSITPRRWSPPGGGAWKVPPRG